MILKAGEVVRLKGYEGPRVFVVAEDFKSWDEYAREMEAEVNKLPWIFRIFTDPIDAVLQKFGDISDVVVLMCFESGEKPFAKSVYYTMLKKAEV